MKKAFDQTVRDLKREVNKKVLKVPSIEQKVLDATSNEPWGPHGSILADIAQATKNYHEYQMIMSVMWKRINDTGKNWRHVYKALTVLEYLVAHGSERVIDEIREHAYQISTLSDFQYIDSSGRDQGNNVRKKSQSLVVLVNDKERIQEVRQKAASNKDKYNTSMGNMYRPGSLSSSGGYGDRNDDDRYEGRYGNKDDDHNGYGRERDWSSRDDGRYGRHGDSYDREGDKYSRDYEERYGRDGYKDDDYGSRSRNSDRDRDSGYEDDGQYSSRGSGAKADDHSQEGSTTGKRLDRKYSEQNLGAPPSYEDAANASRSPSYTETVAESSIAFAPKASSPPTGAGPSPTTAATPPLAPPSPLAPASAPDSNQEVGVFDEFDPRGSFAAAPTTSNGTAPATSGGVEMDPLGFLSESFSSNSLALVPTIQPIMTSEDNASANFSSGPTFVAASSVSTIANQPFGDPFGDGPFKADPSSDSIPAQQRIMTSTNSFDTNYSHSLDVPQPVPQKVATESGNTFYNATYMPSGPSVQTSPANTHFVQQGLSPPNQDVDILADILPPSSSLSFVNTQTDHQVPASQSVSHTNQLASQSNAPQNSFQAQTGQTAGYPTQLGMPSSQTSYPLQSAESVSQSGFLSQSMALTFPVQAGHASQMGFHSQTGQPTSLSGFPSQVSYSQAGVQASLGGQSAQPNPNFYGAYNGMVPPNSNGLLTQHNFLSQSGSAVSITSQTGPQAPQVRSSSSMSLVSTIPTSTQSSAIPQPSKDKFETKSSVWADTLSRGLVNLNISGSKTNPLADIGVDFDAINRKEKRMEKPTITTVTSTVTMGKAMGSGSGMGRAGTNILRPPPNPMMSSGGPVAGAGMGMGMGGYGVNQPMGRGMNMPGTLGMNMGTGQGIQMQQQTMFPPGSTIPGGYNPMMGTGNYGQQPYGSGYR